MAPSYLLAIVYLALALVHAALAWWARAQMAVAGRPARRLALGALANVAVNLALVALSLGWLAGLPAGWQTHLALYGVVAYSGLLILVTRALTRRPPGRPGHIQTIRFHNRKHQQFFCSFHNKSSAVSLN